MDKIALIRAEIERLKRYAEESKREWVNEGYNQNAFAEDCRISSFDKLLTFLNTLPEEPVSEDLEEAAEEYAYTNWEDNDYHEGASEGLPFDAIGHTEKCFKAGAEWGEKNAYKAIMKKADEVRDKRFDTDYEVKIEPAAGFDLGCVNIYREGKLVGQYVEPKEEKKPAEGVEEAAKEYDEAESWRYEALKYPRREAFKAGAEWQRNQLKTNSISAGYNQTDEEYDREMDFATSIIEKEHRQPTFSDAINYGIKLQKEKMMKGAVEGFVGVHLHDKRADVTVHTGYLPKEMGIRGDSKVRVIIVKEEEE